MNASIEPPDVGSVVATITHFDNCYASAKYEAPMTIGVLRSPIVCSNKKDMPLLKLATFGDKVSAAGAVRFDENVLTLTGAEGDYDDEVHSLADAATKLSAAGIRAVLYTSASHTEAKPRWRCLLPFSAPFAGTGASMRAYRKAALKAAEGVLGVAFARESYSLSQSYYYGAVEGAPYTCVLTEGECVDVLYELDQFVVEEESRTPTRDWEPSDFDFKECLNNIVTGEAYHTAAVSLFGHFAATGVRIETALGIVENAFDNGDRSERWRSRFDDLERCAKDVYAKEDRKEKEQAEQHTTAFKPAAVPLDLLTQPLKARDRLYGDLLLRGFVSQIVSPAGVGKSVLSIAVAASCVLADDLIKLAEGYTLRPRKVLMINNEDPLPELLLRTRALVIHFGLAKQLPRLNAGLHIHSGYAAPGKLAVVTDAGDVITTTNFDNLLSHVKAQAIDVVIIDPLVSIHNCNENDNGQMEKVISVLAKLASDGNCAVLIVHHTRKASVGESKGGNVDDRARGASAIVGRIRANYAMARMTAADAEKFIMAEGEYVRYVRWEDGKRNYALPLAKATYLRMESVALSAVCCDTGEVVNESVGVPTPAELHEATKDGAGRWTPAAVVRAIVKADDIAYTSFVATGDDAEALCRTLDCSQTNLKRRFELFPEGGDNAGVVDILSVPHLYWREKVPTENNRWRYHIAIQ